VFVLLLPAFLGLAWYVRSRRWLPVLALVAYLAAGVVVAVNVGISPATNVGAFGRPAQIASEVALAAVLSAFVANGRWRKRARPEPEEPLE
jgi:peptidoglycan/LPS O-acetylase OafA/YrhL